MPPVNRIQELTSIPITLLDPFAFGNPRSMQPRMKEVLNSSLGEFGIVEPIIVRKSKATPGRYEILNGHHRFDALKEMGASQATIAVVDMPDDIKARALVLAVNRIGADWDYVALTSYIDKLIADGGALSTPQWIVNTTGFTATEVEQLAAAGSEFLNDVTRDEQRTETGDQTTESPDDVGGAGEHVNFAVPLNEAQHTVVQKAIRTAKKGRRGATSAEAITRICAAFLEDEQS